MPGYNLLLDYIEMGGFVMPPLIVCSIVLWYALAYRALNIRSHRMNPRETIRKARKKGKVKSNSLVAEAALFAVKASKSTGSREQLKQVINEDFYSRKLQLGQHRMLVRTLVAVAPLLGLLGTVDGMIETFDSLGEMVLFSQSGGIAGGISKALFTTQMGLAVSIPGLLLGRIIERRERNLKLELDQIRDIVCARKKNIVKY